MCLGIPMRVVEASETSAWVEGRGQGGEPGLRRVVSLLLVGPQAVGTPLLIHVDTAVRVLDEAEVPLLESALDGLAASLDGRPFEHHFADLIGRTPELPEHLRPPGSRGAA
jgi:hydrogenase expression/formation protein HypC